MSFDQSHLSRRAITKGAAWSVPAVAVAAAAPSLAASTNCETTYQTITKEFIYQTDVPFLGLRDITVEVTANNVPLVTHPGATLLPIETSSTVTIPEDLAGLLGSVMLGNAAKVSGTSSSESTLSGVIDTVTSTPLTIPLTDFPADGEDLVTVASGAGDPLDVDSATSPGLVVITMGEPSSTLVGYDESGDPNGKTYDSNLQKDPARDEGGYYDLATFTVEECA
ncbi:DUF6801 domain-containing protein [Janibacter cremeus]|uniref:DUF6801 domain-containing protein n=1 Tax=Janibacter cremeus TaxID=1285192 RepID=A0A852VN54_9MICO|nr:DUF6801 domain-containing protein [Janibacter cremeus]NYF98442.1 hypothetical protein [Janibacter cremeus]